MNPTCIYNTSGGATLPWIAAGAAIAVALLTWFLSRAAARSDLLRGAYSEWVMAAYQVIWLYQTVSGDAEIEALKHGIPDDAVLDAWQENSHAWNATGIPAAIATLERTAFRLMTAEPKDSMLEKVEGQTREILETRASEPYPKMTERMFALKKFTKTEVRTRLSEMDWSHWAVGGS